MGAGSAVVEHLQATPPSNPSEDVPPASGERRKRSASSPWKPFGHLGRRLPIATPAVQLHRRASISFVIPKYLRHSVVAGQIYWVTPESGLSSVTCDGGRLLPPLVDVAPAGSTRNLCPGVAYSLRSSGDEARSQVNIEVQSSGLRVGRVRSFPPRRSSAGYSSTTPRWARLIPLPRPSWMYATGTEPGLPAPAQTHSENPRSRCCKGSDSCSRLVALELGPLRFFRFLRPANFPRTGHPPAGGRRLGVERLVVPDRHREPGPVHRSKHFLTLSMRGDFSAYEGLVQPTCSRWRATTVVDGVSGTKSALVSFEPHGMTSYLSSTVCPLWRVLRELCRPPAVRHLLFAETMFRDRDLDGPLVAERVVVPGEGVTAKGSPRNSSGCAAACPDERNGDLIAATPAPYRRGARPSLLIDSLTGLPDRSSYRYAVH